MKSRIWYPQLDLYDTCRRLMALLGIWEGIPPSYERLLIADFYLANPPLLFETSMPDPVRKKFTALGVVRPKNAFLSFPAPPLLFHKMEPIQKRAVNVLSARGLLNNDALKFGELELTVAGRNFIETAGAALLDEERPIAEFLVSEFVVIGSENTIELRKRTGLRRIYA